MRKQVIVCMQKFSAKHNLVTNSCPHSVALQRTPTMLAYGHYVYVYDCTCIRTYACILYQNKIVAKQNFTRTIFSAVFAGRTQHCKKLLRNSRSHGFTKSQQKFFVFALSGKVASLIRFRLGSLQASRQILHLRERGMLSCGTTTKVARFENCFGLFFSFGLSWFLIH